jgi:predicted amidohydrolase
VADAGRPIPVALIQLEIREDEEPAARVARAIGLVAEAAAGGARLVVLPELWATGFFAFDRWEAAAEPVDGPTATALARAARDAGVWLVGGSLLERDEEGIHNAILAWSPAGERVALYRKIHLFSYRSREAELLAPGREPVVFDLEGTAVGLAVCFDLRFPELFRALVDRGAEAFVVVAAWPVEREATWRALLVARAMENQAAVVGCSAAGRQAGRVYAGRSMVLDAWGTILAELDAEPGILGAEIDPAAVRAARREFPVLDCRVELPRPDR